MAQTTPSPDSASRMTPAGQPEAAWPRPHLDEDPVMRKTRTTLTIDEEVLRAVKVRAARSGAADSKVIEDSLRRDLGLDLLDRLWQRNDLSDDEAAALGVEAQHSTRKGRR